MFVVGLTGGIGSGKTAVSDRFQALGIEIVDADVAARVVVEPGTEALEKIASHFGKDLIAEDAHLDRAALRKKVFDDENERHWLEKLLHPLIGTEILRQLENASSPYVIFVSPLMVEAGQIALCDCLLVVDVPEHIQLERTMARDNNDAQQVKSIMATQATREERLAKADYVIVNDCALEQLDQRTTELHSTFLELTKQKNQEI